MKTKVCVLGLWHLGSVYSAWNEDIGWYGLIVPNDFVSVSESGRICVFEHLWQDREV